MTTDDALVALERWKGMHKGRWVQIEHDDGYGASCWEVTLGNIDGHVPAEWRLNHRPRGLPAGRAIYAFEGTSDSTRVPNHVAVWNETEDDWPGPARVILAAIAKAEELGL